MRFNRLALALFVAMVAGSCTSGDSEPLAAQPSVDLDGVYFDVHETPG
jgi:hypothetical protein